MKTASFSVFLGLVGFVSGQVPIPKEEVGFVYNSGSATASVIFDVFLDLVCVDSKLTWPTILEVADYYGPNRLQLTTHLFALPYLRNGFVATKGAHVIEMERNLNETYTFMSKVFDNFDTLKASATLSMSDEQILDKFADIAAEVGVEKSTFKARFPDFESVARVEWKYACTRGIAATPTFMLNDVVVDATERWTVQQWRDKIDPLLQ